MFSASPQNKMKQTSNVSVVIAANSDRMRDSLKYLLQIKPWLEIVGETGQSDVAVEMVSQYHPDLVILDTNLPSEQSWLTVLETASTTPLQTRYLVLTDTTQNVRLAKLANADAVLQKGFTLTELFSTIEALFFTDIQPLSGSKNDDLLNSQPFKLNKNGSAIHLDQSEDL